MTAQSLEDIDNFLKLSDFVATAGQPTAAQFSTIKAAGYQVVVNLALPESPNALPQEQEIVEGLGLEYVNIPVVWEKPTLEDIARFFTVMETRSNQPVFVHCAANKRVSAFMYLHRLICQGMSDEQAQRDLQRIWAPNEIWQAFIQQAIAHYGGNSPKLPGE